MLPFAIQKRLAKEYGSIELSDTVAAVFAKSLDHQAAPEREDYAALMFVDIARFSERVSGLPPTELRRYLESYYALALHHIYSAGGLVDRIAGDGVLAVFSPLLKPGWISDDADTNALSCAETIVASLSQSDYAVKAAISSGTLLFCRSGLPNVYEENTIIGKPITCAYRMDEIASEDQIILQATPRLKRMICDQIKSGRTMTMLLPWENPPRPAVRATWNVVWKTVSLRGIGDMEVGVQTLEWGPHH